jgi:hypothetical protein
LCWQPGQPCYRVDAAAQALARSLKSSGELSKRTPEAEFSNSPGGAAYLAKRSVNELANLAALTARDPAKYYRDLGLDKVFERDEAHDVKRDAEAVPWCQRRGFGCWKRDDSGDDDSVKDKRWCGGEGQACWRAKRAADAVLEAIGDGKDEAAPPFDPSHHSGHYPAYCEGPGILCLKKRTASPDPEASPWCWRPGFGCWKAKRDLQALQVAARKISEAFE